MLTKLRSSKVYARASEREVVLQFVKYGIVGALNVGVHLAIFNLLLIIGAHTLAANAIAFFIATLNSFFLNKTWTFRDERRHSVVRQYLRFLTFTLIGLGLHTAVFSLLLIPLRDYGTIGKNLAVLGALPVSVAWNFMSYKLWTFKRSTAVVV